MKPTSFTMQLVAAMVICLFFSGCLNLDPISDMTRYYVLNTDHGSESIARKYTVFVRNISLSEYLENGQIVERTGRNTVNYLNGHRWAGSLEKMVGGIFVDELNQTGGNYAATTISSGKEQLCLDVDVLRFDFETNKEVVVSFEYILSDFETRDVILHQTISRQSTLPSDATIAQIVGLLEQTLRDGARAIKFD